MISSDQNSENMVNPVKRNQKLLIVVGFLIVFGLGVLIGQVLNIRGWVLDQRGTVDIAKVIDLYSKTRSDEVSFEQFWTVWNKVKDQYVNQPADEVAMFYGAIEGMINSLGDPYSVYFPPKEAEEFAKDLAGEFEGIGAEVGIRDGRIQIIAPLPGSPASQAGLQAGDIVYAIDGEDATNMTLEEAVGKIRGEKGTIVTLTVSHNGYETVEDIQIIRDVINLPTIMWEMLENDVAYISITHFNQNTWGEFDIAVREMMLQSPRALVLDVRSNPGGYLETAIDIASEWVEKGIILYEVSPQTGRKDYQTRGRHRFSDLPTVVLVDEGTASGSEIVAGALQDHDIATIVGVKTYGKGSVQGLEVLPDGSALKLTVAKWYTPEGQEINDEGIMPDVIVEEMFIAVEDEAGEVVDYEDKGLEKALELLK